MAYLPDHEPALGARRSPDKPDWTSGFDLSTGVDLLIHDCQDTAAEYDSRVGWGHSAIGHTIKFATSAGAERLVPFHHDPSHDDDTLDRLVDEALSESQCPFEIVPGTEGAQFDL